MEVDSRLLCIAPRKLEPCACHTQQALGRRALGTNPSPRYSSPHGRRLQRFSVQAQSPGFLQTKDAAADGRDSADFKPVYARQQGPADLDRESGAVSALVQMAGAAGAKLANTEIK
jgi:hypothetical protein